MRIHHEVVGEGGPIVLVHGWGADSISNWVATGWVDVLALLRQVVLMDCRGHGRSEAASTQAEYGYEAMSEDVLQVMNELGIARADFFGYSMGAFMGASLLGKHSDRFSAMVLGGIGDETPTSASVCQRIAPALRAASLNEVTDPLGRAYRHYVDTIAGNDREALAMAALQMWPEGYPLALGGDGLRDVDIPVLIVDGADDHPYVDTVGRFVGAVPGCELVTIPGVDHHTVVADPRFKAAVVDFLQRCA